MSLEQNRKWVAGAVSDLPSCKAYSPNQRVSEVAGNTFPVPSTLSTHE